jgi:hypothetical protein
MKFKEISIGKFVYKALEDPAEIRSHLLKELRAELEQDQREHPDQLWTPEWLEILDTHSFVLKRVNLSDIKPREDLMGWETPDYSFISELRDRVAESKEEILQNPIIPPLVLLEETAELMDGHMRFTLLKESGETEAYAYVAKKT